MSFLEIIKLADIATPKNLKDTLNNIVNNINSADSVANASATYLNTLGIAPSIGNYSISQKTGPGGSHGSSNTEYKGASIATGKNAVAFGVQGESAGDCTLTAGYQAKALEKACIAFGTGIAGRTAQEWVDYYWDVNTWSTPHWNNTGKLEEVSFNDLPEDWQNKGIIKAKKDINGNTTTSDKYYYVLGPSNTKYGQWLLNPAFAAGQGTKAKGQNSTAFGYSSVAKGDHTFVCGQSCNANAHHSFAGGFDTTVDSDFGFAYGYALRTHPAKAYQAVFGKFNTLNPDALLQVGAGSGGTSRKNVFEVLKDNAIKIGKTTLTEANLVKLLALINN